jgi:hypothetical protein
MGAALTYARRYGLFTVVGLAGEDDLDAPQEFIAGKMVDSEVESWRIESPCSDVQLRPEEPDQSPGTRSAADKHFDPAADNDVTGAQGRVDEPQRREGSARRTRRPASVSREPGASAAEPQDLMRGLAAIDNSDALFRWALASLPVRNRVSPDARGTLDAAFYDRAHELGADHELLVGFAHASGPSGPPARISSAHHET